MPSEDAAAPTTNIVVRRLGRRPYAGVYAAMQRFTRSRTETTADEVWLVEHESVYTLGKSPIIGEERRSIHGIEVVAVDRGGDITYHGPGQIVLYPLIDLRRRGLFVREYVKLIEKAVIETLLHYGIDALVHPEAPGVYVQCAGGAGKFAGLEKIASLGVHVSRGATYHGLALNVAMDLSPFSWVSPCGYRQLRVTDMRTLGCEASLEAVADVLLNRLLTLFNQHALEHNHGH